MSPQILGRPHGPDWAFIPIATAYSVEVGFLEFSEWFERAREDGRRSQGVLKLYKEMSGSQIAIGRLGVAMTPTSATASGEPTGRKGRSAPLPFPTGGDSPASVVRGLSLASVSLSRGGFSPSPVASTRFNSWRRDHLQTTQFSADIPGEIHDSKPHRSADRPQSTGSRHNAGAPARPSRRPRSARRARVRRAAGAAGSDSGGGVA